MEEIVRTAAPALLALATTVAFDRATRNKGLDPPGFQADDPAVSNLWSLGSARRVLALSLLCGVLWVGVFLPLGSAGLDQEIDVEALTVPQLFLLHGLLVFTVVVWYGLGFAGGAHRQRGRAATWQAQLGLRAPSVWREIGLGLVAGVGAWLTVVAVLILVGLTIWWMGGEELLPRQPPDLIPWMVALPIGVKLLISLSAGVVEEVFFRGLLQPRIGLLASTALFVLAHASYEQPMMLLGILVLSVIYGVLAQWRQNIWPAIAAHFLFDAVQLLVVIPKALEMLPDEGEGVLVPVAWAWLLPRLGLG